MGLSFNTAYGSTEIAARDSLIVNLKSNGLNPKLLSETEVEVDYYGIHTFEYEKLQDQVFRATLKYKSEEVRWC